jgi:hypothetical protein
MKKLVLLFSFAALLSACAGQSGTQPSNAAAPTANGSAADQAIAQAEAEIKAAKGANYLWSNTEKFLEDAKKAKAEGNNEEAVKLANKAAKHAKLAQQQAKDNANARPRFN